MAKIFISYARPDAEFAGELKRHLEVLGHNSWWFDEGIAPGQKWQEAIFEELKKAEALVILVSEASMQSSWINHELGAALAYSEEKGSPIIIPVFLDPSARISGPISRFQGIQADGDAEETALKIASALRGQTARKQAQEEKRQEVQRHVETSAAEFIQKSLEELKEKETSYRRIAYIWYNLAYLTLLLSVGFGVWRALIVGPTSQNWQPLVELAISGVIVIGLLVALAKYAFTLGKSFMVEALRNADRRHAISFGEFYLRAYGANADWKEVKDAFQHWNIDKESHFLGQNNAEFDPQIFQLAIEIAKAVSGKSGDDKKKSA